MQIWENFKRGWVWALISTLISSFAILIIISQKIYSSVLGFLLLGFAKLYIFLALLMIGIAELGVKKIVSMPSTGSILVSMIIFYLIILIVFFIIFFVISLILGKINRSLELKIESKIVRWIILIIIGILLIMILSILFNLIIPSLSM